MNTERRTSNAERRSAPVKFDLEDRLLDYAARVIHLTERMKPSAAGNYVGGQLLRSRYVSLWAPRGGGGGRVSEGFHSTS